MFGLGRKKNTDQDVQIPYQVYETVHEPAIRRRRLIIRLVLALAVVTLLVAGFLYWRRSGDDGAAGNPQAGQNQQVQQAPQTNPPLPQAPGDPATTPLSDTKNDKTVNQPQ